jgi:hypothetical protein
MTVLGTTQVAVIVAATVVDAHFVQQVVSGQAFNQPGSLSTLARVDSVTFAINRCANSSTHWFKLESQRAT